MMPGKKDFLSIKTVNGSRDYVQKNFILCNLSDFYSSLENQYLRIEISITRLSQLRLQYSGGMVLSRDYTWKRTM